MLLFNRRKVFAAFALTYLVAGCGFKPIYGQGTAASDLHGKIEVSAGTGREYFEMRERLVERFGFATDPRYKLVFTYTAESSGLAVTTTAEVTRYNLSGLSGFKVIDTTSGEVLFNDQVTAFTAYSATSETYPTQIAEQDARARLALALADRIVTQVSSTAAQWVK